jgi:hypothetical protein
MNFMQNTFIELRENCIVKEQRLKLPFELSKDDLRGV